MHQSIVNVEPLAVLVPELRNPVGAIRNAVVLIEPAGNLPGVIEQARHVFLPTSSVQPS